MGPHVQVSNDGIEFKPLGGSPTGPLGIQQELGRQYGDYFSPNAKEELRWEEPKLMKNCWAQAMLNYLYGFSPSCNEDGSFSPKQCSLQSGDLPTDIRKGERMIFCPHVKKN